MCWRCDLMPGVDWPEGVDPREVARGVAVLASVVGAGPEGDAGDLAYLRGRLDLPWRKLRANIDAELDRIDRLVNPT